jgi:uncharacterized membrane protein YgcG
VRVPAGEVLTPSEQRRVERAQRYAQQASGLTFSVYVGVSEEDARAYAHRLHAALADPDLSVLVLCDPSFHTLEIVTGRQAHRVLPDLECRLAAATMQTSFVAGDIVGGLVHGISQLGESARQPATLHARTADD